MDELFFRFKKIKKLLTVKDRVGNSSSNPNHYNAHFNKLRVLVATDQETMVSNVS